MNERSCTICGCDISTLQFNRRRCHNPSCLDAQKKIDRARRNKTTSRLTGASVRFRTGLGNIDAQPYQMVTPRAIRSSGGLNVGREVLDQQRQEEWARLTKKGVGKI